MINTIETNRGFIALVSVIIISFVLVLTAISLNFSGFYARFNVLDMEIKARTEALARGCIEQAKLEIAIDPSFIGSETLNINSYKCKYEVLTGGTIHSESQIGNIYTFYQATVDPNSPNIEIISFQESATRP